jgi:hypothetical protein
VASYTANIARGRIVELYNRVKLNDPNTAVFRVDLLKVAQAAATIVDHDTLAALLAANTVANFTNYVVKTVDDAALATMPAPDDVNERMVLQFPNVTWTSAGGALNNNLVMAVISYAPDPSGATTTMVPCRMFDYVETTTGSSITITFPNGFYQST